MRIDQALKINIGEHLFNPFLCDIIITDIFKNNKTIIFSTTDTRFNRTTYSYENVYHLGLHPDDICDEERSFIYWIKDNREFIEDNLENFDTIKQSYLQGFAMGFSHKLKPSFEEQMQK